MTTTNNEGLTKSITIENFNISMFRALIEQNLMVDKQVILRFDPTTVQSIACMKAQTYLKLWRTPITNLIVVPEDNSNEGLLDFDDVPENESNIS